MQEENKKMTLQIQDQCGKCYGRLVETFEGERVCASCGVIAESRLVEQIAPPSDHNSSVSSDEFLSPGGGKINSYKDHGGKSIKSDISRSLEIAQKYLGTRHSATQQSSGKQVVKKVLFLFRSSIVSSYNEKQLEKDLANLKSHSLNLIRYCGQRLPNEMIQTFVSRYVEEKIEEYPAFAQYFDLKKLDAAASIKLGSKKNIGGRGRQVGSVSLTGYKNTKPIRCNLCNVDFGPRNRCRGHQMRVHPDIPYNLYTKRKNNYVSRPLDEVPDVAIDCSKNKTKVKKNNEVGICVNCNATNAIIGRYTIHTANKGAKTRLTARHKDQLTGKWKICILKERKSPQK